MVISGRKLLAAVLILSVIVCLFIAMKNVIVRRVLETAIERAYGLEIEIGDLDVSFTGSHARMEDVTVYNPPQFEKRELAHLPTINVYFNPLDYLLSDELYVYFLDVELDRINIIKNKDKSLNIKVLDDLSKDKAGDSGYEQVLKEPNKLEIEMLHLVIRDVYFIDNTGRKQTTKRYSVNMDQGFRNVNSFEDISNLIAYNIISQTVLGKTLKIAINPLDASVKDVAVIPGKIAVDVSKRLITLPSIFGKKE